MSLDSFLDRDMERADAAADALADYVHDHAPQIAREPAFREAAWLAWVDDGGPRDEDHSCSFEAHLSELADEEAVRRWDARCDPHARDDEAFEAARDRRDA